jgi:hypothetical protein
MKPIGVRHLSYRFEHPAREEPSWKTVVERWYQLDAFAYGLAQAYVAWKPKLPSPPSLILLASPQASNATDFEFARTGAQSPAKFVHTLANIRSSSLCQVMGWAGPVLCLQKDPSTALQALREAAALIESGHEGAIWVLGVFRSDAGGAGYGAHAFVLGEPAPFEISKGQAVRTAVPTDIALYSWLETPRGSLRLPGHYDLSKREIS